MLSIDNMRPLTMIVLWASSFTIPCAADLAPPGTYELCYGPGDTLPPSCAGDINAALLYNNCVCFVRLPT